jgi:hypothetical protein
MYSDHSLTLNLITNQSSKPIFLHDYKNNINLLQLLLMTLGSSKIVLVVLPVKNDTRRDKALGNISHQMVHAT